MCSKQFSVFYDPIHNRVFERQKFLSMLYRKYCAQSRPTWNNEKVVTIQFLFNRVMSQIVGYTKIYMIKK
jgi:hypothetical protein